MPLNPLKHTILHDNRPKHLPIHPITVVLNFQFKIIHTHILKFIPKSSKQSGLHRSTLQASRRLKGPLARIVRPLGRILRGLGEIPPINSRPHSIKNKKKTTIQPFDPINFTNYLHESPKFLHFFQNICSTDIFISTIPADIQASSGPIVGIIGTITGHNSHESLILGPSTGVIILKNGAIYNISPEILEILGILPNSLYLSSRPQA